MVGELGGEGWAVKSESIYLGRGTVCGGGRKRGLFSWGFGR